MKLTTISIAVSACIMAFPTAVAAQNQGDQNVATEAQAETAGETIFDGDYLSVGIGVGYGASYAGSDDYTAFVLPIVQGSLGGVTISPRPSGIALDFIPDPDGASDRDIKFSAGPVIKLNRDRADIDSIEDKIVEAYGELDTAIEVGPSVGVTFPQVLHSYDSLSFTVDATWDVASAHGGMSINPGLTYFTPLSRGIAASIGMNAMWIDNDYADYYYSVAPTNPTLPAADLLPSFQADSGFERVGANLLLAFDLNGDLTDGGLSLISLGSYSRMLGDAKRTPFTSIRGDADQWLAAIGIGYTF